MAKSSKNPIRTKHEPWTLDDRNNLPYSGESIQAFIKQTFEVKVGDLYYDPNNNRYLAFADQENRELYLTDPESHAELLLGAFEAPAPYTAELTMQTQDTTILITDKGNYLNFSFDIKNKSGSSTGEAGLVTITIVNAGNTRKYSRVANSGEPVSILIDDWISEGQNNIYVTVTGRTSLAATTASVKFNVINLRLSGSFDFQPADETLEMGYVLLGAGTKYVEWYVDNEQLDDEDVILDNKNEVRIKQIDVTDLEDGLHNVQARAYILSNNVKFYSQTIYFDFVKVSAGSSLTGTFPLLGLTLSEPMEEPEMSVEQYQELSYRLAMYDSLGRGMTAVIEDNGTTIQSISLVNPDSEEDIQTMVYAPTEAGTHTLEITIGEATRSIDVDVEESAVGISEATTGLALRLRAKGRNNSEANPAQWTYGNIATVFSGFAWNEQSGWNGGALVMPTGTSIAIGIAPLASNVTSQGRTIEIDYECVRLDEGDESAEVASLVNTLTGAGLTLTASTAQLVSANGAKVSTKYRDGDRVHLAFIINRTTGENSRLISIVNNGILERVASYGASDNFTAGGNLTIAPDGCTIKIYGIRVYNRALTVDEAFGNFAVDSSDIIEIADRNDIYDEATGQIDVDKVNAHIPVMIITGDISSILSISDKSHKDDWNNYPVQIEFRDMKNPERNFFIDDADIRLQGTSSISYPRKNFRIYSKSKSGKYASKLYSPTHEPSDLVADGKYSFKPNAAPVACWCLKADYAESSGSHNTGVARLWNQVMKDANQGGSYLLRTAAQQWAAQNEYPYDVRTTIDGFPIVLFQRDNVDSPLVCYGQYNFNNDKSTEEVFGFTALEKEGAEPFDNSNVECWEVLDSDNEIALFTDVSDFDNSWDQAFEARYPKNPSTTALKAVAEFLNSCYDPTDESIDVEAWQEGKADHFDLPKLAAYYVYLMRFGAVDQTVKNAMFTTEDGEHWFYINYDNDTILGIDNASRQFDTWDYGLTSQTPGGGYYYAGKGKSVLWRLFEADPECMALARQIDALLFSAGLNYEKAIEMFDDEQSSQWCERLFNTNGEYKYIIPFKERGENVLYMLQGSRKSHRHWFLSRRFEKWDNLFGNGTYSMRAIQARASSEVNIPQGSAYKFTPAISSYFGYAVASTTVDAPTLRTAGTEYTATGLPQATGVGNFIYIFNANNIAILDLSAYITALGYLTVGAAVDKNGESRLKSLILGDGETTNAYLDAISGLSSIKSLEELDIRGFTAITTIDLTALANLHKFYAVYSGLTDFEPAQGASLTEVSLPSGLHRIALNGVAMDDGALSYSPNSALNEVDIRNITGTWDAAEFVLDWIDTLSAAQLASAKLTLYGIDWQMDVEDLLALANVGTLNIRGTIDVGVVTAEEYEDIVEAFGTSHFDEGATFRIKASGLFIEGPSSILSGNTAQYSVRDLAGRQGTTTWSVEGGGGTGISFDTTTAVLTTQELSSDGSITIRATFVVEGEVLRVDQTISIGKRVYPTDASITLNGNPRLVNGSEFSWETTTEGVNGSMTAEWSLSGDIAAMATIGTRSLNQCTVLLGTPTAMAVTGTLTLVIKKAVDSTTISTKTMNVSYQNENIAIMRASNAVLMDIMYNNGLCANQDYMTKDECAVVIESQLMSSSSVSSSIFYNQTSLTSFNELEFFTGLETLPKHLLSFCTNLRSVTIPSNILYLGGLGSNVGIENITFKARQTPVTLIENLCLVNNSFDLSDISFICNGGAITYGKSGGHQYDTASHIQIGDISVDGQACIRANTNNNSYSYGSAIIDILHVTKLIGHNQYNPAIDLSINTLNNRYWTVNIGNLPSDSKYLTAQSGNTPITINLSENIHDIPQTCFMSGVIKCQGRIDSIGSDNNFYNPNRCYLLNNYVLPNSINSGSGSTSSWKERYVVRHSLLQDYKTTFSSIANNFTDDPTLNEMVDWNITADDVIGQAIGTIIHVNKVYDATFADGTDGQVTTTEDIEQQDGFFETNTSQNDVTRTVPYTINGITKTCNITQHQQDAHCIEATYYVANPSSKTKLAETSFIRNDITGVYVNGKKRVMPSGQYVEQSIYIEDNDVVLFSGVGTSIRGSALYISNLKTVKIPEGVTTIGTMGFYMCSKLTTVYLPSTITSIGNNCFGSCSLLENVYSYAATAPTLGNNAVFQSVKSGGTLHYPANSDYSTWMQNANYYLGLYNWSEDATL